MDELVKKLSEGRHPIEASRPRKTSAALKECIDRNYVHIMFKNTGTELGMELDRIDCQLDGSDFESSRGVVQLAGSLVLNFQKVRLFAKIDLSTMEGEGYLSPIK